MATNSYETGRQSEDWAVDYLTGLGWTIVARNFRGRRGEIDVIARDGRALVFLEIKGSLRQPRVEAVLPRQILRVRGAAEEFMVRNRLSLESEVRFDALFVWGPPYQVTHLRDAF
ncbi:MAG: YraN family protein [Candidatus Eremiobacteraeota bacterium]|nr:YraN family protein [Candidatus Eremiobacteraeota bacterium]